METAFNLITFLLLLGLVVFAVQLISGLFWWLVIIALAAIGAILSAFSRKK